jgi:MoCo/4Fe-4S cofactor protein with predicted Tat translocation signal
MKKTDKFISSDAHSLTPCPSPKGRGDFEYDPKGRGEKKYWRSLGELNDTPEFRAFLEAEFPVKDDPQGISRRRWLQLMGASLVLAGAASCRWEKREILPFEKRPPNRTPGKFERFATTMDMGGTTQGLLVTCVDGRPIKIEGNPKHHYSFGATNAYAQATILQLYDPDRSKNIVQIINKKDKVKTWDEFSAFIQPHIAQLRAKQGQGLAVLSEISTSPTQAAQRAKLLTDFPKAIYLEYEPIGYDSSELRTHLSLDKAEVIVCLDADLFGNHPAAVKLASDFAAGREATDGKMNRLYAIESCFSITGAMADHRLAIRSAEIAGIAKLLHGVVANNESNMVGIDPTVEKFVSALGNDLLAHKGKCVVVAGSGQPEEVQRIVRDINIKLENAGQTVDYTEAPTLGQRQQIDGLKTLVGEMNAGNVETLLILGGNPVYNSPADIDFAAALKKVPKSIHLSLYCDETSLECSWHLPQSHFLESWGDAQAYDGTYSIIQPMIDPLYRGKSAIELLAMILTDKPATALELVRATAKEIIGTDDFERLWRVVVHDGLFAGGALQKKDSKDILAKMDSDGGSPHPSPLPTNLRSVPGEGTIKNGELEIFFRPSAAIFDGRFANNSWLQEMPDPLTRLTWDNVVVLSPKTAAQLGVEDNTLVKLKYKGRELEMPVYILPGQAEGTAAVTLGYGRTAAGLIGGSTTDGVPSVGASVYKLRTSNAMYFGTGLSIEPTGKPYTLATVEDHYAIDRVGKEGREERLGELVREASLDEYKKHPEFAKHAVHHPPLDSLWQEHQFEGHRWGMTIDLAKCTGCGACVIACMAENNVPVVGRERIFRNREMHWLRVDRYFRGDVDNPQIVLQPVACHHCEMAPCEAVCPVAATVHNVEGLNEMVYNRCVGTRYCGNNCPYKVRRFNFFNYHKQYEEARNEVLKMASNPQVTVRSRGVMEKCSYCVQRIQAVKIDAKNARRQIQDGEIKTACQQVCPAGAIIFGDLSDKNSAVAKSKSCNRSYEMLAELNVKPRTSYLARIRNPNPELEGF